MILFDWQKIFNAADANAYACYRIMKMLAFKEVPNNEKDFIYKYSKMDFSGYSFLVHPEPLLVDAYKYSFREVGVYLALASTRSVADYATYGDTTLNLLKVGESEIIYNQIKNNRLLYMEGEDILHFKYEEVPPKQEIH
jgi:hypothetical protein